MFSREEAVKLVHKAIINTNKEDETFILSQKMKSVNMFELANTISDKIKDIGIRPGEKLNETLISENEVPYTFVNGKFITIRNYKNKGKNSLDGKYSSENAEFMTRKEMIKAVAETNKSLERSLLESRIY
jgi:FlaA1/EpsC-like NDP-sugar epimerase